jgi:hypothetical protein
MIYLLGTFKKELFGSIDPALFAAYLFFAGIGIFFVLMLGTQLRNQNSQRKFSWAYLFSDNAKRIYASIIAVVISIRFAHDIFGWEINSFKAFCIGTAWDGIALFIKQKTNILDPSPKPQS